MAGREDKWVAVQPDATSKATFIPSVKPATTAFQFFQKEATPMVKAELAGGAFDVGQFSRIMRDRWAQLDPDERERFDEMARRDLFRFRSESHAADVAAIQRRERLQREREQMLLLDDDDDEDDGGFGPRRRTTRGRAKKLEKKKERKERKKQPRQRKRKAIADDDDDEFVDEDDDEESSDSYEEESDESDDSADSDDSHRPKKKPKPKPKPKPPPRKASTKQIEYRQRVKEEKKEKEEYVQVRQEDLRKEKAVQAKKRLEFLLKQSNIFSHFGQVKQDQAKYGIKANAAPATNAEGGGGRFNRADENHAEELDEADEHQATYLTTQPTTLGFGTMRQYQLEGLNWMIRLQENGINGILADEMGLGKTLQSISILVYMLEYRNSTGPHLIIVPKSTLSNWMNELARWAPTLKPVKFHGDKASRDEIANNIMCPGQRDDDRNWHVCVTTYEVCNIEKNVLNKFAWSYLIIDEAHRLKNEASTFSKTVRAFETKYRILLTGTPLQNSLHELWALLNFLVPDVFASAEQFDEWFNLDIEDDDEKNRLISQLHKILRPFMLRRLKKEVEKSLPPKHETILFTGMSAMQKKLYRDILIRDIDALQGNSGSRTAILNIVMQLRKAAGHPYLFPGVEDRSLPPLGEHLVENCGKMVLLDKLLRRLQERGHRVLLFTQMTRILDILEDYLVMRKFKYCRIDGNTSYEMREDYIDAYNAPNSEKFLFLLSTRAGGLGINLQTADVVILYDSDWNPQADLQAQDRAHRIGQKREVQVFRFVTEHTVEEKIVERAQQKLKLDAMVVQQGRLKDKDKQLSRDELLEAVRFGADKIFKSKDSSITDEDIDLILDAGKRKTQELNEKLKTAEKGDLLDFKLDGNSNLQTFEGVDYSSNAFAQAKAEAELMGIIDMGKRERRTVANYNENLLYQQQISALQGDKSKEKKKKTVIRLPKEMRLPRMEEWQMFNRTRLMEIQEIEETNFRALPEEVQRNASVKKKPSETSTAESKPAADAGGSVIDSKDKSENPEEKPAGGESKPAGLEGEGVQDDNQGEKKEGAKTEEGESKNEPVELPPLLTEELAAEKQKLLAEGFVTWSRSHYTAFTRASAKYGRKNTQKIALEVGKSEEDVHNYARAFWGDLGKSRFSEHEYDRVQKFVERGEKKIFEAKALERGTRILLSLFDNPWEELEFTHVSTKDKLFSVDNDRYLLCWTHKYGYGQWEAIKMAIRRSPKFRFDYFLRSLPVDLIARRCEHLMKAAEKEVEYLEKKAREEAGLPTDANFGEELPPIKLPPFKVIQKQRRLEKKAQAAKTKDELEKKVEDIEEQMKAIQDRLKELSRENPEAAMRSNGASRASVPIPRSTSVESAPPAFDETKGAIGPDGEFLEFPEYDGQEPPKDCKKPFTHFCMKNRKKVKASLDDFDRRNKAKVNEILREQWMALLDDEKEVWRVWAAWDKKRYERDLALHNDSSGVAQNEPNEEEEDEEEDKGPETPVMHIPKKRVASSDCPPASPIPKKKKHSKSI